MAQLPLESKIIFKNPSKIFFHNSPWAKLRVWNWIESELNR